MPGPFIIKEVFAFVAIDPKDGDEGVIGALLGDTWMPLVAADEKRIRDYIKLADEITSKSGVPYKILRFATREDVTEDLRAKFSLFG